MSSNIRWAMILLGSLLLWAPSGIGFFQGKLTFDGALLRYAVALALCSIGVSIIGRMIDAYAKQAEVTARKEAAEARRRRAEDQAAPEPRDPTASDDS
jgi:hypothetical protein